jgi:hypothetical protein
MFFEAPEEDNPRERLNHAVEAKTDKGNASCQKTEEHRRNSLENIVTNSEIFKRNASFVRVFHAILPVDFG